MHQNAIAGEAHNADEARAQLIDLLLDIHIPGETGFEFLSSLEAVPLTIFTTAYDVHALHAFDVHALNYLLKPVQGSRLTATLKKVRLQKREGAAEPLQLLPPRAAEPLAQAVAGLEGLLLALAKSKIPLTNT